MTHEELEKKVVDWAARRHLLVSSTPHKQFLKFMSEVGELADHMAKEDWNATQDDLGDIQVTLILLSALIGGWTLTDCLEHAYEEIKDRKGSTINGIFVKESN